MGESIRGTYRPAGSPNLSAAGGMQCSEVDMTKDCYLKFVEQQAPLFEDQVVGVAVVEHRYSATNINSTATTVVKTGAGLLHALIIGTPVASSVITIFDNTAASGTVLLKITLPATLLNQGPMAVIIDAIFATGLTVLTATGASDLTVTWR